MDSNSIMYKYMDIIIKLSKVTGLSLNASFHKFYNSKVYQRINENPTKDILSESDEFFVRELIEEN